MNTFLYRAAATWTGIGLASGLFFRELTKSQDFDGRTQLAGVSGPGHMTLTAGFILFFLVLRGRGQAVPAQRP
jgi:hypothetical protein